MLKQVWLNVKCPPERPTQDSIIVRSGGLAPLLAARATVRQLDTGGSQRFYPSTCPPELCEGGSPFLGTQMGGLRKRWWQFCLP
ncbi:MAG: hypothetical protein ABSE63_12330 [Thermoguttaceae bacterium]|jgi:hypothetical protein